MTGARQKRVAVIDEHEIFRLGLAAALEAEPQLSVVHVGATGPCPVEADVAVVCIRAAESQRFHCPLVVCAAEPFDRSRIASQSRIAAVLSRATLTGEQLVATVRAVAAGLQVGSNGAPHITGGAQLPRLDARRRHILRLLAAGADTATISNELSYSVRTIKSLIQDIERELAATNRAQAVAEGIRQGII